MTFQLAQYEPGADIGPALKREADAYLRELFGVLYDSLPESVKREAEREYVERRAAEMGVELREQVPQALPIILLVGGLLFFMMRRKR